MKSIGFYWVLVVAAVCIQCTVQAQNLPTNLRSNNQGKALELFKVGSESQSDSHTARKIQQNTQKRIQKSSLYEGTGSSGGGDPLEISARPFSNLDLLQSALEMAIHTVQTSTIPEKWKLDFETEVRLLSAQKKILTVPAIIISSQQIRVFGYKAPHEEGKFLSLGCYTPFLAKGAPIYCAQDRLNQYDEEDLATTLLHEVLHHIVPKVLSKDEEFIEDLTQAIISNNFSPALQFALDKSIYIRPGVIKAEQFINFLEFDWEKSIQKRQLKYTSDFREYFGKKWTDHEIKMYVIARLPENIADLPLSYVVSILTQEIVARDSRIINPTVTNWIVTNAFVDSLKRLGNTQLPSSIQNAIDSFDVGCKKMEKTVFNRTCELEDRIKFSEFMSSQLTK